MSLIKKLHKTKILSVKGLVALLSSMSKNGMNLMTLLGFSAKVNPNKTALNYQNTKYTYAELFEYSLTLSFVFEEIFNVRNSNKIGIISRNNDFVVKSLFSLSTIGTNVYFLNADMSEGHLVNVIEKLKLDFVVHDFEKLSVSKIKLLAKNDIIKAFEEYHREKKIKRKGLRNGDIVVLSGGTTGQAKTAKRKASIKDYANPFFALLTEMDLDNFKSTYIAPPIYHGFGLSSLIIAFLLGAEVFISDKFETTKSLELIEKNKIEVICLVPLMLQRMIDKDKSKMKSLRRIISGGAPLSHSLVKETLSELGDVLYNLYGTSEAGFSVLASPEILTEHPKSIGKSIRGVNLKIINDDGKILSANKIGKICIKTAWSMQNKAEKWVDTGDLGYLDEKGNLFLSGRADEMIVSAGENVFPSVLENALYEHKNIKEVAVIGVDDKEFGQRLKAFIVLKEGKKINESEINIWLKERVARYEMPAEIAFVDELPYTKVGKIDKKSLKANL